jgi:hypothetical protein
MVLRRVLPRFSIARLLLAFAIASPLSVALAGYATGARCPLCFSGRVIPVYHGIRAMSCGSIERAERGEIHPEFGAATSHARWYCRACELEW